VSHSKIRTEKVCLNCGTETTGRFCPACGQENIEPKQTVWHLVTHFFSDITHFDGKFFVTVKDLFAKPGFLSREYMIGKRVSYLDPIRMYIFTSAVFFLIFFSLVDVKRVHMGTDLKAEILSDPDLQVLMVSAKTAGDTLRIINRYNLRVNPLIKINYDSSDKKPDEHSKMKTKYRSFAAYDSAQRLLPAADRDGWYQRKYVAKKIEIVNRVNADSGVFFKELFSNFIHSFPKILFISLPVFALLLKLLYVRRKQFYYVDHGIFAVHQFIFTFLVLLVYFSVIKLYEDTGWSWLQWVIAAIVIYPFVYFYKAMRRFYGQRRGKTILKYILLFVLAFVVELIIFSGFALFTLVET
jgi:hypothetical protein